MLFYDKFKKLSKFNSYIFLYYRFCQGSTKKYKNIKMTNKLESKDDDAIALKPRITLVNALLKFHALKNKVFIKSWKFRKLW